MSFGNHRPSVAVGKDEALATFASSLYAALFPNACRQQPLRHSYIPQVIYSRKGAGPVGLAACEAPLPANPVALSLTPFLAMASTAGVAAPIPHLVSVEMIEGFVSAFRMWTNVAVMRIEAIINVAVEVVRTVEPRAGSDEHAARKPLWPIVPVRGATVWGVVIVAIRARRLCSDIDGDLPGYRVRNAQRSGKQGRKGK